MKRVTSLDVGCPLRHALPGGSCYQLDGGGPTSSHEPRRKRARQEQARMNPEHVAGQRPLWGKAPS